MLLFSFLRVVKRAIYRRQQFRDLFLVHQVEASFGIDTLNYELSCKIESSASITDVILKNYISKLKSDDSIYALTILRKYILVINFMTATLLAAKKIKTLLLIV